jgi:hypothetical protein
MFRYYAWRPDSRADLQGFALGTSLRLLPPVQADGHGFSGALNPSSNGGDLEILSGNYRLSANRGRLGAQQHAPISPKSRLNLR